MLKGLPGGVHGELEGKEGPYDELLLVPGNFTVPQPTPTPSGQPHIKIPKKAQRISRIYVSQRTTTYNGRLNWNIPKQLARFSFSAPPTAPGASPPSTLTVQVFPPGTKEGDGGAPFFACTLKPWQWVPAMPLNTKYLPLSMAAAQPPLPSAPRHEKAVREVQEGLQVDDYDTDVKKMDAVLVGTQKWRAFDIAAVTPRARGCWVEVHEKKESEAVESASTSVYNIKRMPLKRMLILSIILIAILFIMMRSFLPYDVRWTSKLLRRDVRNLRAKYTIRSKHQGGRVDAATSSSAHQQAYTKNVSQLPRGVQCSKPSSQRAGQDSVYSRPPQDSPRTPQTSRENCPGTLYDLLESRLRATYASRDRDMSHEDRWRFRGSWLVLHRAIQGCRSEKSDDASSVGTDEASENTMLLDMLNLSTQSPTPKVSGRPATPYTRHNSDHDRYDSMFGDVPTPTVTPSPTQLWLSILEATDDTQKIAPMAEQLLGYISREKKAFDIIEQVGNPHKKFSDADDAQLRLQFRELLCPETMSSRPSC
ncbi:hypothetical protein J4E83_010940 [Alternaria metachromatica]|uniref:uncharacterized protein n=1 Tax=Alternaria metachromatica TaxID=283354 RepID=UPI0020C2A634|nr:uncharacterized protein J4E83_010940 [Alternaria metachromatica]KAI4604892.1 hypothetical protein J4E83_010940 [Alternaria metachromatica]